MGIVKGAISFGSNFNIGAAGPIDSRMRVETVADLTDIKTVWTADAPAYQGMTVTVMETGDIYVLKTDDPSVLSNWKKIGDVSGDISDLNVKVKANADAIAVNKTAIETEVSNRTSAVAQAKTDLIGSDTTVDTIKYAEAKADAAQKTADDFIGRKDGFATSAQGAKADTAIQDVSLVSAADKYLSVAKDGTKVSLASKGIDDAIKTAADAVKVSVKNGGYITGTVDEAGRAITLGSTTHAVSTATSTADGLATAADVKSYVDTTSGAAASAAINNIASASKSNTAGSDVVVTVSTAKGSVSSVAVDASVLKKAAADDATAKANAAKTDVIGTDEDTKASDTIKGAKLYAVDAAKTAADGVTVTAGTVTGETLITASASGKAVTVGSSAALKTAVSKANSAVQTVVNATDDKYITVSKDAAGTGITVASKGIDAAIKTATDAVAVTAGVATDETLITASASGKAVTVGSSAALKTAVANANSALQEVTGTNAITVTDKSKIALKIDTTTAGNVTLTQGTNGLKASVNIPAAKVDGVAAADKILTLGADKLISATVALSYEEDETDNKKYICLKGKDGANLGKIDASDFIKDGMVDSVAYDEKTHKLTITFNTGAGKDPIVVDLSTLVDTYKAGTGLTLADDGTFSVNTTVIATKTSVDTLSGKVTANTNAIGTAKTDSAAATGLYKVIDDKVAAEASARDTAITNKINALDKVDTAVAKQLVSAVSEKDGVITVSRRALVAEDIPTITTEKISDFTVKTGKFLEGKNKTTSADDSGLSISGYGLNGGLHGVSVYADRIESSGQQTITSAILFDDSGITFADATTSAQSDYNAYDHPIIIKGVDIPTEATGVEYDYAATNKKYVDNKITAEATTRGTAITNAINALDVANNVSAAVNGVTVTVNETDGKVAKPVVAIAAGSVASGNGNLVTGGVVYTAVEAAKTAASTALDTALTWGTI